MQLLHIPTATVFDVPDVYSDPLDAPNAYIKWLAFCAICRDLSARSRLTWFYMPSEEQMMIFKYNVWEYVILDDKSRGIADD